MATLTAQALPELRSGAPCVTGSSGRHGDGSGAESLRHRRALEASDQVALLEPFFANVGKRLVKSPKLYFKDTGLLAFLLGITPEALGTSPLTGALWENLVFCELAKWLDYVRPEWTLWFCRDQQQGEADFLVRGPWNRIRVLDAKWSESPSARAFPSCESVAEILERADDISNKRSPRASGEAFSLSFRVRNERRPRGLVHPGGRRRHSSCRCESESQDLPMPTRSHSYAAAVLAFIAAPLASQTASFSKLPFPCAGPGNATYTVSGPPRLGQAMDLVYTGPNRSSAFSVDRPILVLGAGLVGPVALPPGVPVAPAECFMTPTPEWVAWMPGGPVFQSTVSLAIPSDPSLIGATFHLQWVRYAAQLRNPPFFWFEGSEVGRATVGV